MHFFAFLSKFLLFGNLLIYGMARKSAPTRQIGKIRLLLTHIRTISLPIWILLMLHLKKKETLFFIKRGNFKTQNL